MSLKWKIFEDNNILSEPDGCLVKIQLLFACYVNYFEAPPYWPPFWIARSQITLVCSSNHIRVRRPRICQNWVVDRLLHFNANINYLRICHFGRHLELHAPKWLSCALMVIFVFSDPKLVKIKWSIVCILPVWVLYWTAAILTAILNISLPFENPAIQQAFSDSAGSIHPRSIKK